MSRTDRSILPRALTAIFGMLALWGCNREVAPEKTDIERVRQSLKRMIGPNGSMMNALRQYETDTGEFPKELKWLVERPTGTPNAEKWNGPYFLDKSALSDPWGHEYRYVVPGMHNPKGVDLWTVGPDGVNGTQDDTVNWEK